MTEEDIDKLFNRSKSKSKTKTEQRQIDDWKKPKPIKDFVGSVKFLKLDDSTDKLLNGMPINTDFD